MIKKVTEIGKQQKTLTNRKAKQHNVLSSELQEWLESFMNEHDDVLRELAKR